MSIQFILNENLFQIFDLLVKSDVYSCVFVCDGWYKAAVHVYYESINIVKKPTNFDQLLKYGHSTKKFIFG